MLNHHCITRSDFEKPVAADIDPVAFVVYGAGDAAM